MHWSNFHDFCDFLHDIGLWIPFLLTVFSFRVNIFIDYLAHLRNKMHMPMHMHFISHKSGSRKQKWKSRHDCHQCRGCNLHLFLDLQYMNFSVIKPSCIFYFTMTVNHPFQRRKEGGNNKFDEANKILKNIKYLPVSVNVHFFGRR